MTHQRSTLLALLGATALALPASAQDGLTIFDWAGYEDPSFHPAYVDQHGGSPEFAFFGDEDEAFEKLRAGFEADVSHPCSQSVVKWREAGLLKPIDTSRITNWKDIQPGIAAMPDFMTDDEGVAWIVPFEWGNTVLTYRTDNVDAADVASLQAFADPKFMDRVSIGNNVDDAYALASLAIGLTDWTQMTDEQFVQASDFLRKVHQNVRLYWSDSTEISQALASGEVDLAWAWNDAAVLAAGEGVPVAVKRDTAEGLSTWVCGYSLLANGAGDENLAYDFLNATLDTRVSEYMVTAWGYGHANAAGMAAMDQAVVEAAGYADVDKFVNNTLFQSPVSNDLKQRMIAEFEKIKAGY
jgi:spermidine/putrescine transport system substrate-binding protein